MPDMKEYKRSFTFSETLPGAGDSGSITAYEDFTGTVQTVSSGGGSPVIPSPRLNVTVNLSASSGVQCAFRVKLALTGAPKSYGALPLYHAWNTYPVFAGCGEGKDALSPCATVCGCGVGEPPSASNVTVYSTVFSSSLQDTAENITAAVITAIIIIFVHLLDISTKKYFFIYIKIIN